MKLSELEAELKPGSLRFVCPRCRDTLQHHYITISLGVNSWQIVSGSDVTNVTIVPSIWIEEHNPKPMCGLHVNIQNGEVVGNTSR